MTTITQVTRDSGHILSYSSGDRSFESCVLTSGTSYVAGSVLGRVINRQAASPIPTIVGTGSGVMTLLTFGPDVQVGSYVITLTETSATAAYTVVAPDGTSLPNGAVGTAYSSNHLSFLISDGGTMTAADAFTVVVTAGGTPVLIGTGTGVVSSFSLGRDAMHGTYRVELLATSATAAFEVIAPDGQQIKGGKVATAYASSHINFTLANGGTMTVGDYFNFLVTGYLIPNSVLWDPTAVDGSNVAWGILLNGVDATSAAKDGAAIVRDAEEVSAASLTWKSTVAAAQKTEAYRHLAAAHVLIR